MATKNPGVAGNIGGFRSAYEFRKWMSGDIKKKAKASDVLNFDDEITRQFLEGLTESVQAGVKKLVDSYEIKEKKLLEQIRVLKKSREEKREATKKRQALEARKEEGDISNLIAMHQFEQQRKQFNAKVMAQYRLLKGFRPNKQQEMAYNALFGRISELTAYRTKRDITAKDLKDIKKLEGNVAKLSGLLGENLRKKLDKLEKGTSEGHTKWFRTWSDYRHDMSLFKDMVLDGLKGLGRKILRGIGNIGIGPLTIGNVAKLIMGSIGATAWVGGAAVTGFGALASKLGLFRGAAAIGRGVMGGAKAVASGIGGAFRGNQAEEIQREEESTEKLTEIFGRYVRHTMNYRDKMLSNLRKQLRQLNASQRLGGFGVNIGNLLKGIATALLGSKMFTAAGGLMKGLISKMIPGILAALGGIAAGGSKLLGKIGGLLSRFVVSPAGMLLMAGAGGVALGSAIYKTFDTQILDGIEWVFDKFNQLTQFFKDKWQQLKDLYEKGKGSVKKFFGIGTKEGYGIDLSGEAGVDFDTFGGATPPTGTPSTTTPIKSPTSSVPSSVDSAAAMVGRSTGPLPDYIGGEPKVSDVISKLSGSANIQDLDPAVRKNFLMMAEEYKQMTGKKLGVTSGYRSSEEQEHLYNTKPAGMAAPPGRSLHEYGYAADVSRQQADELEKLGLLRKYGFNRPLAKSSKPEPWHITPIGASVAAIKSGMEVGDATNAMSMGNTTAVPDTFVAPPAEVAAGETTMADAGGLGTGQKGSIMSDQKIGVGEIPTFSTVDQTLLAMNVGVFSNAN